MDYNLKTNENHQINRNSLQTCDKQHAYGLSRFVHFVNFSLLAATAVGERRRFGPAFFRTTATSHYEAKIFVIGRQSLYSYRVNGSIAANGPQVVISELSSQLVGLRVHNIYDLSSVS